MITNVWGIKQSVRFEPGRCRCGCNTLTPIARTNDSKSGRVKGQPLLYAPGHHLRKLVQFLPQDNGHVTACWFWLLTKNANGYGLYCPRVGKCVSAHRWVYEQTYGKLCHELQLDHLCRTPGCVNPSHLEAVTARENVRRSRAAKLTAEAIAEIRA